jgi:hypothetical protein
MFHTDELDKICRLDEGIESSSGVGKPTGQILSSESQITEGLVFLTCAVFNLQGWKVQSFSTGYVTKYAMQAEDTQYV